MDLLTWKQNGMAHLQKYKYVLLILLVGVFLMVLPEEKERPEVVPAETVQPGLPESLARILSLVEGAGRVEVLLTEAAGPQTLYQTDEDISRTETARDIRRDTVLITGGSREEAGLVKQVLPPTYQGAVVLCQGADNARVRLDVVNAVMSVTGLRSDKITVLKMK